MGARLTGYAPIQMRRVLCAGEIERAGDFYWHFDRAGRLLLGVALPLPRPRAEAEWRIGQFLIRRTDTDDVHAASDETSWTWNGDAERPTLSPALHSDGISHCCVRGGTLVEA